MSDQRAEVPPCEACGEHHREEGECAMTPTDMAAPGNVAASLLEEILLYADENGGLANATADDLRDALRLAADRLRAVEGRRPTGPIYKGARRLVAEVWRMVERHDLNARSMAADAALDLRDSIDPDWWPVAEHERPVTSGPSTSCANGAPSGGDVGPDDAGR